MALGDLDGDGDLDAWVVNEGFNQVWLNGELTEIQSINLEAGQVTIDYLGTLESCPVVDGDYELVEDARSSPYTFKPDSKARFLGVNEFISLNDLETYLPVTKARPT